VPLLVTPHFTSDEFAQPSGRGFNRAAYPTDWIASRLKPLCEQLEVIRAALPTGSMVKIGSGYRSEGYNRALPGTARLSQHVQGLAADIVVPGVAPADVHALVLKLYAEKAIRIGGLGYYARTDVAPGFVHVDIRPGVRLARWNGSPRREEVG